MGKAHSRAFLSSSITLKGRLASVAVGLNGQVWLFGGYTVAEDHSKISSPDNFTYDVVKDEYSRFSPMPVPVDDAVALIYQNRYIYLISGWHNDGNVKLTRVYDTKSDSWSQASPFSGKPVFGQAGGIVGNRLLICDGVEVIPLPDKRRTFATESACYTGTIDPNNHLDIDWRTVPHPTGTARYRMAAKGITWNGKSGVLFIGGSDNPYNYNGICYHGISSNPDDRIWYDDFDNASWKITTYNNNPKNKVSDSIATMGHRGLLEIQEGCLIIAGMSEQQKVLDRITFFDKSKLLTSITKD